MSNKLATRARLQPIMWWILAVTSLFISARAEASTKAHDYKPGQKIEYKSSNFPEIWEEATFVGATPGSSQAIIRQKPNEFHKEGFQRATNWENIRPLAAKPDKAKDEANDKEARTETAKDVGGGLMSQADVLQFLQANMGDKPYQNPRREEIKKELAAMIKGRGLSFRYSTTLVDFNTKLAKYGANTSDVAFPLRDNYGPPTKQNWLMGAWKLDKVGADVHKAGEIGVSNVGTLTLNPNRTYVWKSVTAESTRGKWRRATKDEMKSQGGDGIVLLRAKSGEDWIVTQDRATTLKGDWINIAQLEARQIKEYGSRGNRR